MSAAGALGVCSLQVTPPCLLTDLGLRPCLCRCGENPQVSAQRSAVVKAGLLRGGKWRLFFLLSLRPLGKIWESFLTRYSVMIYHQQVLNTALLPQPAESKRHKVWRSPWAHGGLFCCLCFRARSSPSGTKHAILGLAERRSRGLAGPAAVPEDRVPPAPAPAPAHTPTHTPAHLHAFPSRHPTHCHHANASTAHGAYPRQKCEDK